MQNKPASASAAELERERLRVLFRRGEWETAARECRRAGRVLGEFQEQIDQGAQHLLETRRAGTVLSFLHKYNVRVAAPLPVLLRSVFEAGDYHGFLKALHQFQITDGYAEEMQTAMARLTEKGHGADAAAWEKKIRALPCV